MSRFRLIAALALAFAVTGCSNDRTRRTEQQLAELQKKKDAEKRAQKEKEEKLAAPVESVKLDPPYDDLSSERVVADGPCPAGFWALFPGEVPGATPDEKKANAARKAELAKAFVGKRYLVRLRAPAQVTLKPHDAAAGVLPIEVVGTIDCTDSIGRIAIAWTDAKATTPKPSALREGSEVTQNLWLAPPVPFTLPMTSMSEAKTFHQRNALGLTARVVFTPGKAEVDQKLKKVGQVKTESAGETVAFGGGLEDWGAGRLLRAELVGVRVAVEQEKKQLFELKGSAAAP